MPSENYYVKTIVDANTITISTTVGGTAITFGSAAGTFFGTRQATFNLNSTGAVAIKENNGATVHSADVPRYGAVGNNNYGTLIYDELWDRGCLPEEIIQFDACRSITNGQ